MKKRNVNNIGIQQCSKLSNPSKELIQKSTVKWNGREITISNIFSY